MTDLLEDDGGLHISRGSEDIGPGSKTTISADTDSASSSDKSLIWNHGYESTSAFDHLVIDGPVTETGDYKITVWFSNYATAWPRPNYRGKVKIHYSHSGEGDTALVYNQLTGWNTITHPNGTEFFKPWSWYTGGTQYGDPDYAGNHQNSAGVPALTAMGPWKAETPSFTVTDADELVRLWIQPYDAGFFLSLIQVTKV